MDTSVVSRSITFTSCVSVIGRSTGEGAGEEKKQKCIGLELSSASISTSNRLFDTALYMEIL